MENWKDVKTNSIYSISSDEKYKLNCMSYIISTAIKRRNDLNLSQRDLADRSGLKQSAIARIEKLNSVPRIDTLIRILRCLDLEILLVPKE